MWGGVRSDQKNFDLKPFKTCQIDFSQILQQLLYSISEHFLFYGDPVGSLLHRLFGTFSLDNPFRAGGRGVRSDPPSQIVSFHPKTDCFRSKSLKIKFPATFVLLITQKYLFLDHFWVSESSIFKSGQI